MKKIIIFLLCLMAFVVSTDGGCKEPVTGPDIFSYVSGPCSRDGIKGPFLTGSFKPGLNVTLINESQLCLARTGAQFSFEQMDEAVQATYLAENEKCTEGFFLAVVGVDVNAVNLVPPKDVHLSVDKGIETEARRLLDPDGSQTKADGDYTLSGSRPRVLSVGKFTLFKFGLKGCEEDGPAMLFFDNRFFKLEGDCTDGHVFFAINSRLHIGYVNGGCGNGVYDVFVYDLSGGAPKRVYADDELST